VDAWVSEAVPLPPPSNVERAVRYKPPIVETQLRAAVATLVQRQRRSNRVDVPAAVELIAQQRPLGSVPRLNESTTARGAVVVADVGRTMMPYLDDVDRFVAELQHVVGSPNATVAWWDGKEYYVGDCGRAVPMPSDTPIVVISTLGAVRPSGAASDRAHWLEFADSAERAGADVVALVPHRLPQWPAGIAGAMRIVAWDDLPLVGRGRG
jgi:hypothetical protein